ISQQWHWKWVVLTVLTFLFVSGVNAQEWTPWPIEVDEIPYSKEKFHIYLFIGQSNMAGRAPIEDQDKIIMERTYLLNKEDKWELAQPGTHIPRPAELTATAMRYMHALPLQGYNRYSTV